MDWDTRNHVASLFHLVLLLLGKQPHGTLGPPYVWIWNGLGYNTIHNTPSPAFSPRQRASLLAANNFLHAPSYSIIRCWTRHIYRYGFGMDWETIRHTVSARRWKVIEKTNLARARAEGGYYTTNSGGRGGESHRFLLGIQSVTTRPHMYVPSRRSQQYGHQKVLRVVDLDVGTLYNVKTTDNTRHTQQYTNMRLLTVVHSHHPGRRRPWWSS